ncbi:MAG: type II toxin-antitoxin system HicA family toxin [Patescibacteria group bacterium]
MSDWRSRKGKQVLAALIKIGWKVKRQRGSHVVLERTNWSDYVWSFRDNEELGRRMLVRISKKTGLKPEDL